MTKANRLLSLIHNAPTVESTKSQSSLEIEACVQSTVRTCFSHWMQSHVSALYTSGLLLLFWQPALHTAGIILCNCY